MTPLNPSNPRVLEGIKVLELCRIIAGPTIARILGEYGATVLKVTGPGLSDVPFFQVDGNVGKHTTELDLKSPGGRQIFESLLQDADIVVDGYRPGALDKLGYGSKALSEMAMKRKKGIVYVNENCFGYEGEWAGRAGWQQIADCVSVLLLFLRATQLNELFRSVEWHGLRASSWVLTSRWYHLSHSQIMARVVWGPSLLFLVSTTVQPEAVRGMAKPLFSPMICFSSAWDYTQNPSKRRCGLNYLLNFSH